MLIPRVFALLRLDLMFLFAIVFAMVVKPASDDAVVLIAVGALLLLGIAVTAQGIARARRSQPRRGADRVRLPQWPQPQPPPQQPPPPPEPVVKLGFEVAPTTANDESCFSTFAAPQLGQVTTWSSERTSSSKCSSQAMHAYS